MLSKENLFFTVEPEDNNHLCQELFNTEEMMKLNTGINSNNFSFHFQSRPLQVEGIFPLEHVYILF